jgi:hypothetical protein
MRSHLHICFATLILALFTGGCTGLRLSVNDANPPVFSFSTSHLAECCDHLSFFMVAEIPADGSEPIIIWDIKPVSGTDNSADGLPKITYGQVPAGFVQKYPGAGLPQRLAEGKIYQAYGPPVEVPEAQVRFRIQNGKVVQIPRR